MTADNASADGEPADGRASAMCRASSAALRVSYFLALHPPENVRDKASLHVDAILGLAVI
jgi:hypothetical protein